MRLCERTTRAPVCAVAPSTSTRRSALSTGRRPHGGSRCTLGRARALAAHVPGTGIVVRGLPLVLDHREVVPTPEVVIPPVVTTTI